MGLSDLIGQTKGRCSGPQSLSLTASVSIGIRFERDGYFRLVLPTCCVKPVKDVIARSPPLPTPCDLCGRPIESYPFISKHHYSYREYHVACALGAGIVLPLDFERALSEVPKRKALIQNASRKDEIWT